LGEEEIFVMFLCEKCL